MSSDVYMTDNFLKARVWYCDWSLVTTSNSMLFLCYHNKEVVQYVGGLVYGSLLKNLVRPNHILLLL